MNFWIVLSVCVLALIGAVLSLWIVMQKGYEKAIISYRNKLLSQEMEEVKGLYKTMRGWRHDYHNHMQSVKAYLAREDFRGPGAIWMGWKGIWTEFVCYLILVM